MNTMKEKKPTRVKCFTFHYESGFLIATLPSGRQLFYAKPRIMRNEYDRDSLTYEGVGTGKRWERIESYGPKQIVMHVHDEAVIETPMDTDVDTVCKIMSQTPSWATGLILNAAGYECMFYQKD